MKKVMGLFDVNRLSELVSIYLNPPAEFTIFASGEVSKNKAPWLKRKLNIKDDETMDFLSVVQEISDKLVTQKANMPIVSYLCGSALGILLETNDRSLVVETLYQAHLMSEDLNSKILLRPNNNGQNQKPRIEVTAQVIERTQPRRSGRVQVYDNRKMNSSVAEDIADAMNNADIIYIGE
jgi:hypothetical protein